MSLDFGQVFQERLVVVPPEADEVLLPQQFPLRVRTLGELVVTSGQIVACDPLVMPDDPPFADSVAPGRYPVLISFALLEKGKDQRIAFAMLRLSERPAQCWENAIPHVQYLSDLKSGQPYCYGVDTGTGCFMDADAARALIARNKEAEARGDDPVILDAMYTTEESWLNITLDQATGANVITFFSGWGDGRYPSYWGLDASGERVALVTDFCVIDPDWFTNS